MLKYIEGNLKVKSINLHYYRTGGNKPPFVLLHGATDNGLCWTPLAEVLEDRFDVVMPDAQGHGSSDRLGQDFQFMDHARQVASLIQQLDLKKPFVMGHSMGAGTAVNLAAEYPDLPRGIVLEDPGWNSHEAFKALSEEEKARQREMFGKFLSGFNKKTREEIIAECRKANPAWSESEIIPWAESKLQFDPALFARMQLDRPSYTEQLPKIKCPLLLIISDGGVVSPKTAEQAAQLWTSQKPYAWVQIKGAGHNIRREQFKQFCEVLWPFLEKHIDGRLQGNTL
jgi:N-formylmaleamate deformylase